jgi:hypothetical protein
VINYFDLNVSSSTSKTEFSNEKNFIHLISSYLIGQKNLMDINLGLELEINSADLSNIFDSMLKNKNLTQFTRLFEEKSLFKKSKLNAKLVEFLNETNAKIDDNLSEEPIIVEILCVLPFLFRQESNASSLVVNLNALLISAINSHIDKNLENLEKQTFLLSLNIWSNIMLNRLENLSSSIHQICELFPNINKLENNIKIETSNKYDRVLFDKCDNNLLRGLNYYVVIFAKQNFKSGTQNAMQVKSSIQNIIDLLKKHLSAPYHEVIKFIYFCFKRIKILI